MKQLLFLASVLYLAPLVTMIEVDPATFSRLQLDYVVVGGGTTGLAVAAR